MSGDLDETSLAIGRIEAGVKSLKEQNAAQWKKLDSIEKTLTAHRIKMAGFVAGVYMFIEIIKASLASMFKNGGGS